MAKFEFSESGCTFIPDLTIAREGRLRDFVEDFETFMGRITGRSGNLYDEFNSSSVEFSDLIAWKITDEADYDQSKWQEAVLSISYLIAVTSEWADIVEDYKDTRQMNIDRWKNSERLHLKKIQNAERNDSTVWTGAKDRAIDAMKKDFKEQRKKAQKDWEKFEEDAEEIGDKLKKGATEDNIRQLQDAGYLSWAPYNIMGSQYDKPEIPEIPDFGHGVPKPGSDPEDVNLWWENLSPAKQKELKADYPDELRMMNGIPVIVRDELNQAFLEKEVERAKAEHGEKSTEFEELEQLMKNLNEEDNNAYLLALDTSGGVGRAIVSEGNPDTADNVATLVPGTDTDWMSVNGQHGRAQRLKSDADAVLGEDSGVNNAVISWIGYDAPTKVEAPFPFNVKSGADELIDFQAGLSATQQGNPPNTTLIGHSYGSTVVGHALQKSERASSDDDQNSGPLLEVDNVIAVGSPGMDVQHVSELNIPSSNVHVSQGDDDWISSTPDWAHGSDPSSDEFGATVFDSPGYGHSDYFNTPRSGPMVYMGEVIAGTR